jgi:uncharacterized membrane protein SirB2
MKNFLQKFIDDLLIVTGCGLVLVGVWKVCPVATWFVGGCMCVIAGVVIGLAGGRK